MVNRHGIYVPSQYTVNSKEERSLEECHHTGLLDVLLDAYLIVDAQATMAERIEHEMGYFRPCLPEISRS